MPFRFPLAAVLLVREEAEKREERALQKIQVDITRVLLQIEQLTVDIANTHIARERAMQKPIPAVELHSYLFKIQACEEAKKTLLKTLQALELDRDQQLKVYQAAHRDHETIIDMFNEQRETYEQKQARSEQKSLDDIFGARRHRS
ncbi:MAG: flagellar FliJ family protein [Terracidiphilus sp.]|jgi:flagellar export protein FliJ